MVNVIVAKSAYDCEELLGKFLDESHYDILIEEDTDCYLPATCDMATRAECAANGKTNCSDCTKGADERRIAFKFRKNYFSKEEQEQAYIGLREAATNSQNRGLAAGPKGEKCGDREWVTEFQHRVIQELLKVDSLQTYDIKESIQFLRNKYQEIETSRGMVWLSSEVEKHNFDFEEWLNKVVRYNDVEMINSEAEWVAETLISNTSYANAVRSGIAGWFDRYPRIPYGRPTAYTEHHYDKFKLAFPFLQSLSRGFKELLPWRYGNQMVAASKLDSRFLVPGTPFTTVTVNGNFRTAAHRDAGDFSDGLSNLLVLSNDGKFTGGYLVFPEVRIAVNVRPGDLLLVNNHEVIHGNTPIIAENGSERISLVCYFREAMLDLGSWEYEAARRSFVDSRRTNPDHPLWHKRWNGISSGMWSSQEWYDFCENAIGREELIKHHPEVGVKESSLSSLFG